MSAAATVLLFLAGVVLIVFAVFMLWAIPLGADGLSEGQLIATLVIFSGGPLVGGIALILSAFWGAFRH
jgi:hypothetical protein